MASSSAATVEDYLAGLPADRADVVRAVRDVIIERLPPGYEETMNWGMISYEIPLERYPDTYNGHPLGVAALAAQKHHYSLYLNAAYTSPELLDQLRAAYADAASEYAALERNELREAARAVMAVAATSGRG